MTPRITPSSVRKVRSLCAPSAETATRRISSGLTSSRSFLLVDLGQRVVHDDGVSVLELAQGLEGAGHDLLASREPRQDLDIELPVDPRLDGRELRLPALQHEDPFLVPI